LSDPQCPTLWSLTVISQAGSIEVPVFATVPCNPSAQQEPTGGDDVRWQVCHHSRNETKAFPQATYDKNVEHGTF